MGIVKALQNQSSIVQALGAILITGLGYAGGFLFEVGYLSAFRIDYSMAQVTISTLVIGILSTLAVFMLFYWLLLIPKNITTLNRPYRDYAVVMGIILFFTVSYSFLLASVHFSLFTFLLAPVLGFLIFALVFMLTYPLIMKVVLKRPYKQAILESFGKPSAERSFKVDSFGDVMIYIFVFVTIISLCYGLGRTFGNNVSTYSVLKEDGKCYLVVRKYDDEILVKDASASLREHSDTYYLLKLKDLMLFVNVATSEISPCKKPINHTDK